MSIFDDIDEVFSDIGDAVVDLVEHIQETGGDSIGDTTEIAEDELGIGNRKRKR